MILMSDNEGLRACYTQALRCFSCGERLTDKAKVWWHGYTEDGSEGGTTFALHSGCAGKLALHLASDALEADLKNGKHIWNHGSPVGS